MTIAAWPLAHRSRVVHAYKPGGRSTLEGPFRTLRKHAWATAGVRLAPRVDRRLAGQLTIFSSLNIESARMARHGDLGAAVRLALSAAELEDSAEFGNLSRILSELPVVDARRVVEGVIPDGAPAELTEAVRKVARRTEQLRTRELARAALAEVTAGRVKEVHDSYVLLVLMNGPETLIPRWMAVAAGRERVGAFLALVTDKLDGSSAVVEAVPAIDVDEDVQTGGFSPFGRDNRRLTTVTADDERVLMGEPEPLRVLVPVTIAS